MTRPTTDPATTTTWDRSDRVVAAVALLAALLHLVRVDSAPPGFFDDEAAIAAQAICVAQSGHELFGARWPAFAPLIGDGLVTPVTLYVSGAWTWIFGTSIFAFRLLANVMALVGAAGVAYGGRSTRERLWLGALVLTSPWLFSVSRMFMDPVFGFAALGWMFGLYRRERWAGFGVASALAAMTYPPLRVQIALTWAVLLVVDRAGRRARPWLGGWARATVCAALAGTPMWLALSDPAYRARGWSLAIWNQNFMEAHGLTFTPTAANLAGLAQIYADNLRLFLTPSFLLWDGDANLRHGVGVGVLAWVEVAALAWIVGARLTRQPTPSARATVRGLLLVLASVTGAALTNEGLPHTLRSIGAAAALAWLVADVVTQAGPRARATLTAALVVGASAFAWVHLSRAPQNGPWFQEDVVKAAAHGDPLPADTPRPARDYYDLTSGRTRCRADDPR